MSQIRLLFQGHLLLWATVVSMMSVPTNGQTPSPTTSADSQLPLKAAIILKQEFCESDSSKGSYWKTGKTTYFTGRIFCREAERALKGTFTSLTRTSDVAMAGDAQLMLIPKYIGMNEKLHLASSDLTIAYEWAVKDSAGNTVWVATVEGHAHGHKKDEIFVDSMNDFFAQSATKMSSSPELLRFAENVRRNKQ
jgi:hypothetical protein